MQSLQSVQPARPAQNARPRRCTAQPSQPASAQRRGVACAAGAVLDVTEATFEAEVLQSPVPVLVDFWATWCGPCKLISVVVAQVAKDAGVGLKVVKIETDPNPGLVEKYGIYGLPTVLLFSGGAMVEGSKREGAITKAKLIEHLAAHGVAMAPSA